jgi:hypothetical protein
MPLLKTKNSSIEDHDHSTKLLNFFGDIIEETHKQEKKPTKTSKI